jgi:trehalose 6-phosphate phosphatase
VTAEELAERLEPLRREPRRSAVVSDFDGTLSPIVLYPGAARPAAGVVELLHRLAARFGCVAVVSGRPAAFLVERLELATHPAGLRALGLYGLEEADATGKVTALPAAEPWRAAVAEAAERAGRELPPGVHIERKGLSIVLHWRRAPEAAGQVLEFVAALAPALGLEVRSGRMAAELAPPLPVDKGSTVEQLCAGCSAALYMGDDIGDLPALLALGRLARDSGLFPLRVAVASDEAPAELLAAADLVVDGVQGAVGLLAALDSGS